MYLVRIANTQWILVDEETNQFTKIYHSMVLSEDHGRVMVRYSNNTPILNFSRNVNYFVLADDLDIENTFNFYFSNESTESLAIIFLKKAIKNKHENRERV